MNKEVVIEMLSTAAQRHAVEMYLGVAKETLSDETMKLRNEAMEECLKAESDVADAALEVEVNMKATQAFEELVNKDELVEAENLEEKREILVRKISELKESFKGVDIERAQQLQEENEKLESRIATLERHNELMRLLMTQNGFLN